MDHPIVESERDRVGLILKNNVCLVVEVSLSFEFPTTHDQAEYEAFITCLILAVEIRVENINLIINSQPKVS